MRYLPQTPADIASMLAKVGVPSLDELFRVVPEESRRQEELNLPAPLTEWGLEAHLASLAGSQDSKPLVFLGAGSYEHHIPAVLTYLLSRSEFVTCYTPYQPEMSQGTLQAIYEYQTLTARLLGLDVANASLYDGATALAEALLMAIRVSGENRVAVSRAIHPLYRRVVETYFRPAGFEVLDLPYGPDGRTDLSALEETSGLAGVALQSPNFFGVIEDLETASLKAHEKDALSVSVFTEPLAFGLIKSPGSQGVDVACGEGQSLGIPQSFGGPGLGIFAARMKYVRAVPGRLVGETKDLNGRRGYVLTLATREQHIRREKAVSNICTNNSLCALAAAMYLAALGGSGLRELAGLMRDKAEYLKSELLKAGMALTFTGPTFNEFVAELPIGDYERLLKKNIVAGLPLGRYYPELEGRYLLCVTETKTRQDMDLLVKELGS